MEYFVCVLQMIYYHVYCTKGVSQRVCYYVVVNVKLLRIIWMSDSKDITML